MSYTSKCKIRNIRVQQHDHSYEITLYTSGNVIIKYLPQHCKLEFGRKDAAQIGKKYMSAQKLIVFSINNCWLQFARTIVLLVWN